METKKLRYVSAIILMGLGSITSFLSAYIIFDLFDIRAKEGNYVLFVVWANFISSILYLFSSYGFIKNRSWTKIILGSASIILIISFVTLKIHIGNGGIYETKTVGAMVFKISLTFVLTLIAYLTTQKDNLNELKK